MKSLMAMTTAVPALATSTPGMAQSFWNGVDNDAIRSDLRDVSMQRNGDPFGGTFSQSMIQPDTGARSR